MNWSATVSDDWISIKPAHGTSEGEATVSVDPHLLSPGSHSGYVLLTSQDGAATARIRVKMAIPIPPARPEAANSAAGVLPVQSKPPEQAVKQEPKPVAVATPPPTAAASHPEAKPEKLAAALPPPGPAPASDCGPGYHRRTSGTLTWHTSGALLAKGASKTIETNQDPEGGEVDGQLLPGCPVQVTAGTPGVEVVEQPSLADGYLRVKLRNDSASPISQIELKWRIK